MALVVEHVARLTQSCQPCDGGWIKQIEDLLVVDLQEGSEHGDVLGFAGLLADRLDLLEELHDTSLSDTLIDVTGVILGNFALIAFHGERFTRARLTIGKYRSMVALDDPVDKLAAPQAVIDVVLSVIWVEDLVEAVELTTVEATRLIHLLRAVLLVRGCIGNFDVLVVSDGYLGRRVPLLFLVGEHRPDPDCDLDASMRLLLASLGTELGDAHAERLTS